MKHILLTLVIFFLLFLLLTHLTQKLNHNFQESNVNRNRNRKKLAFCFLIYDEINHEELWKYFFDGADPSQYNIYIHYKKDVPLHYFENKKIQNCIDTQWGDKSLVKASNLLFRTAYNDDVDNYKFILVSNSCVPFKSFNHVYQMMTEDNFSYMNIANPNMDRYRNTNLYKAYADAIGKSAQWVILNRELVEKTAFIPDEQIDHELDDIFAPDEIYYYTMVKANHLENQVKTTPNLSSGSTTFTYWDDMHDHPFPHNDSGIKNYNSITATEVEYLCNSPCLFGRKFVKNCIVVWNENTQQSLYQYLSKKI